MTYTTKFALRNLSGEIVSYWASKDVAFAQVAPTTVRAPSHHIIVVDRSGSMYYDMAEMRSQIEKVLTHSEFNDPTLRITLISYSGQRDCKLHFARVTVEDVMRADSPYLKEIRGIQPTGLTCISQGLAMAETLIDDKEITAVSLHSDGYANDASPTAERRALDTLVASIAAKHKNVFVNTVAYNRYSDFNLLSSIANNLSGTCTQALSIRDVYKALYDTTALLTKNMSPAIEISGGDIVLFISNAERKVLGSDESLTVRGVSEGSQKTAYKIDNMDKAQWDKIICPEAGPGAPVLYALARYFLSVGEINLAKYAVVATRDKNMLSQHYRALVAADLADFASDLEKQVFEGNASVFTADYGMPKQTSILELCSVINEHNTGMLISMEEVYKAYTRRGVERVEGVRDEKGEVQKPLYSLKTDGSSWINPSAFKINDSEANVNMLVTVPAKLWDNQKNEEVKEVAGIVLNLHDFKNYTIVGDGVCTLPELHVRITDKALHGKLVALGVVSGKFDHKATHVIALKDMPVTSFGTDASLPANIFTDLCKWKTIVSITKVLADTAKTDGEGTAFSAEQIAELKEHFISPSLYFSPPTTTSYSSLEDAIKTGRVDYRTSYQCVIGNTNIVHLKDLYGADEYLARRFTLTVDGADVAKPSLSYMYNPKAKWAVKALTARTKLNAVDDLMFPIFEDLLGFKKTGEFYSKIKDIAIDKAVEAYKYAQTQEEALFVHVRHLAFYVSATGIVPESLNAHMVEAEAFETTYGMKLGKAEKEGTFFVLPDKTTLVIFARSKMFTKSTTP